MVSVLDGDLQSVTQQELEHYAGGVPDERPYPTGLLLATRHTSRGLAVRVVRNPGGTYGVRCG